MTKSQLWHFRTTTEGNERLFYFRAKLLPNARREARAIVKKRTRVSILWEQGITISPEARMPYESVRIYLVRSEQSGEATALLL